MPVAVVTDSGSDLPPDLASSHPIVVVPLMVAFDDASFRDGVDLPTAAFWDRLAGPLDRDDVAVTVAGPVERAAGLVDRIAEA